MLCQLKLFLFMNLFLYSHLGVAGIKKNFCLKIVQRASRPLLKSEGIRNIAGYSPKMENLICPKDYVDFLTNLINDGKNLSESSLLAANFHLLDSSILNSTYRFNYHNLRFFTEKMQCYTIYQRVRFVLSAKMNVCFEEPRLVGGIVNPRKIQMRVLCSNSVGKKDAPALQNLKARLKSMDWVLVEQLIGEIQKPNNSVEFADQLAEAVNLVIKGWGKDFDSLDCRFILPLFPPLARSHRVKIFEECQLPVFSKALAYDLIDAWIKHKSTNSYSPTQLARDLPDYLSEGMKTFSGSEKALLVDSLRINKEWCDDDIWTFLRNVGLEHGRVNSLLCRFLPSSWKEDMLITVIRKFAFLDWV